MKSYKKNFFLFFDDHAQFLLVFFKFLSGSLVLLASHQLFTLLWFILKLLDSDNISFDFMFNDSDGCVSNLISDQELMKLREITICLENI
jgi:hypothetical protein